MFAALFWPLLFSAAIVFLIVAISINMRGWIYLSSIIGLISALGTSAWIISRVLAWTKNQPHPPTKFHYLITVPCLIFVGTMFAIFMSEFFLEVRNSYPDPDSTLPSNPEAAFLEEKLTPLYLRQASALASGHGARHPEVFSISAQIAAYVRGFPDLDPAKLLNRKRIIFFHLILEQKNIIASRSAEGLGALHPEVLKAQRVIAELEKLRDELP